MHRCKTWDDRRFWAVWAAGLVMASTSVAVAVDSEWPTWRGPERDGISQETGLLSAWPEGGPPLAWQVEGLGRGFSSLAVVGDQMYTMGELRQPERGAYVIALNRDDGSQVWATRIGTGQPNCTPTVDENRVYALDREGRLACLSTENGRLLWEVNFPEQFGGRMMSGWGYSESPLIDGDRLIVTPGSRSAALAALDKRTGEVIWATRLPNNLGDRGQDGAGYSSVVISEAGGVRQYVQLMGRGLISVDADSGQLLWHYNRIANGTANIPTPIVAGDYVFCSSGYQTGAALLRVQRGARRYQEVYFLGHRDMQNHHGGMVRVGEFIYCGHGHNQGFPLCISMASGETQWQPGRGPGSGSAAVLYADGHLYFRYEDGVLALIEANPREYRLKGSFRAATVNGKAWPHPVIVDGHLFLRDQDTLMCYDIRDQ